MPERRAERLEILDLMRLFAALSVMVYHFTYHPTYLGPGNVDRFALLQGVSKYGYLGVELFFLISGFVIFWSATGRTLATYAASRISRLLPTLWAAILLTSVILVLAGKSAGIVEPKVLAANMAVVAGPLNLPYVDGVYWTLQYEVKFYVLAWLVIWSSQRLRPEIWLALWLLGLAGAHAGIAPKAVRGLTLFPYGSYFVAGSLFFLIWRDGLSRLRAGLLAVAFVLSLLCLRGEAPRFMFGDESLQALLIAGAIVGAQYLLFYAVALRKLEISASGWWVWLGSLTYPLYLVHNVIRRTLAARYAPMLGDVTAMLLGMAASVALAAVFSRTTETYGCHWLRRMLMDGFNRLRWRAAPATAAAARQPP